jgi:hypothetical protein
MKKSVSLFLLAVTMFALMPVNDLAARSTSFKSCAELRKKHPNGIALNTRVAKKTKATVSPALYRKNKSLDTNGNKIACEKGEPKKKVLKGFGSGTKVVGATGIAPGRYLTTTAKSCYWARLSGFRGTLEEIIANDNARGSHVIVDIKATDAGFTSSGCGTWFRYIPSPPKSFGDGVWSVGDEMSAGTWSASPSSYCYWARVSGFSGSLDEIIANEFLTDSAVVEIEATDAGFISSGCGTWRRIN